MLSIQQLIKALRKLQNSGNGDLMVRSVKQVAASTSATTTTTSSGATTPGAANSTAPAMEASLSSLEEGPISAEQHEQQQLLPMLSLLLPLLQQRPQTTDSSQQSRVTCETSQHSTTTSLDSHSFANSTNSVSAEIEALSPSAPSSLAVAKTSTTNALNKHASSTTTTAAAAINFVHLQHRSQQIQNFYQQHLHHFHTQNHHSLNAKQKQTQFAMSSLAAEPLTLKQDDAINMNGSERGATPDTASGSKDESSTEQQNNSASSTSGKPCYNAGLGQILQFMELIGNLKHTKRTGWVLRDVNDCESISGHMYRMSMMTFLLDGTEGLNQIRCMELALVHDLAESLVGDITPFCGVSKTEKRAMEFKAMEDICKLIEPRGKRIMALFEEYETGESAESKFVKDLDRLDMVMQAFEYEKRDNCLLRHQEFFDSTAGKFQHPFVQKLVDEIYEQRRNLARAKGATPPPPVHVPDMEAEPLTNGHSVDAANAALEKQKSKSSSSS